jgi:hypothetical protein
MAWQTYSSSPLKFLTVGPAVCLTKWVLSPLIFYLKTEGEVTEHCRHNLCFRKWPMSSNHPDIMIPDLCQKPSKFYYKCYKHRHLKGFSFLSWLQQNDSKVTPNFLCDGSSFLRNNADKWKKSTTHICLEYNSIMCLQCKMWYKRATSMIHKISDLFSDT